ncbi:MAG TPA: hypothetical protein VLH80_03195, partial [Nitrospiraceae bacterium]|nr:hypothetical protein [Nitrospiraceae bacterium]
SKVARDTREDRAHDVEVLSLPVALFPPAAPISPISGSCWPQKRHKYCGGKRRKTMTQPSRPHNPQCVCHTYESLAPGRGTRRT